MVAGGGRESALGRAMVDRHVLTKAACWFTSFWPHHNVLLYRVIVLPYHFSESVVVHLLGTGVKRKIGAFGSFLVSS